jgi:hypothetical protein
VRALAAGDRPIAASDACRERRRSDELHCTLC